MNNLVIYTLFKRTFDEPSKPDELRCEQEPAPKNRALSGIARENNVEDLVHHYRGNGSRLKVGDEIITIPTEKRSVGVYTDYPVEEATILDFEEKFLKRSRE